jgi:long-chain acyl-CoA synthetase
MSMPDRKRVTERLMESHYLKSPLHGVGKPRPPLATISAMFARAVDDAPEAVAFGHRDVSLTYSEAGRAVAALARRLASLVQPGAVAALVLPNSIEFGIAYFAALEALTTPALLNPSYPASQLEILLREVSAGVIICVPSTRDRVADLPGALGGSHVICLEENVTIATLVAETQGSATLRQPEPEEVGALLFSGGTTGLSKIVEHTHERLVISARCLERIWPTRAREEVFLPIAPFSHIYGFMMGLLFPISASAEIVIPERFQPEHIVDLFARRRVTIFGGGPPAIYAGVLAAANLAAADLTALRVCPAGGAPFPVELMERWRRATGLQIQEGYGMTEMAPISATTNVSGVRPGSVGMVVPGSEVQVVDLETGTRVLRRGERGEVRVRGPHMMTGYRNRPEETARAIRNGYIYTGDIGHLDEDGFLFITDRKKDVVFVKGFNVFPREVEEAVHTHPKVGAVGVVGVPDARTSGERLIAFVVPGKGEALDVGEIITHCASRLAAYQCPSEIRIVTSLPMTGAQKLDRVALRSTARCERKTLTD